jgi:CRP/FNR family transcriptional regulator, cyclic AMP receptor protein
LATAESLLADVPLFQALDATERSTLASSVSTVDFPAGTRVFRRGDPGGALYVVSRGLVDISVETTTGDRVLLDQLGPGDFFGEISLLDGRERTADATAADETRAFEIDRADLEELFRKHPDAALDVLGVIGRRLREADRLLQSQSSVSPNQEVSERTTPVQRVAEALARFSGSIPFLVWHALLFLAWIVVNVNLLPYVRAFDPFPFGFLTMAVSLESIFLSCFVLIAQSRQAAGDRIRSDVEYAANIRAGKEVTQLHGKVDTLYAEIMARLALLDRTLSGPRPPRGG